MKNFKILLLAGLATMAFTACGGADDPEQTPQEVVREGMNNLSDAQSGSFELAFSGADPVTGTNIAMTLDGSYDTSEKDSPVMAFELELSADVEGTTQGASAEMKFLDDTFYFMVGDIVGAENEVPQELIDAFADKWWSMELPPEYSETFNTFSGSEGELSSEEQALKDLFTETDFFTDLEYVGVEKVAGEKAYHYTASLDTDSILDYMEASLAISAAGVPEAELDAGLNEIQDGLSQIDFDGGVWISIDDKVLVKIAGKASVEEGPAMDFSYTTTAINNNVSVEAPADAQLFDPLALLMGGGF